MGHSLNEIAKSIHLHDEDPQYLHSISEEKNFIGYVDGGMDRHIDGTLAYMAIQTFAITTHPSHPLESSKSGILFIVLG